MVYSNIFFYKKVTKCLTLSVVLVMLRFLTYTEKGIIISENEYEIKYVLQWTSKYNSPFDLLEERNSVFLRRKCKSTNCYITDNKLMFFTIQEFDAILFNGVDVSNLRLRLLPKERSPTQKYIFVAKESADRYPVCYKHFDGFFNWTWTYKLNSDFRWGYITIYDLKGNLVGPKINMKWDAKMPPIDGQLKQIFSKKTVAAAWFVSHCNTKRNREQFVRKLRRQLCKFGLYIDIFGKCRSRTCPKGSQKCFEMIRDKYYFYLSFENSFAADYVTEKLNTAIQNYAVPIVFGGANYSRFLPPGTYLNARELGPRRLAALMNYIIKNKTVYYNFFRWRNSYVYKDDFYGVCNLCTMLNDREKVKNFSLWNNFRSWWNEERACL